jgi:cyclophilin family peptidyl-prolyl cis-trans isomerase/HEAT repeat protein
MGPRRPSASLAALWTIAAVALPVPAAAAGAAGASLRAIAVAEDRRSDADGAIARGLTDKDRGVRVRAALAAGRLQDSTWVDALAARLADRAPEVRREAVFALGQTGHRSARPAIERALGDRDSAVVDLAIEALGKLGDKAATPAVTPFLASPMARRRGEAAVALWRLADSTALTALLARHDDPEAEVRWRMLYAMERVVAPERVVRVVAQHLDDADPEVRARAARTLGRQKSMMATAYLLQALADPDRDVVVEALRSLRLVADSTTGAVARRVMRSLSHPDPHVRATAATILADRFAWARADSATRHALRDSLRARLADPDVATRSACARTLLEREGVAAVPAVEPLLADGWLYPRAAVIESFGRLPAPVALPRLLPYLDPSRPTLERMTAAEALGAVGAPSTAPALRAGLADTSMLYAAACASALAAMKDGASVPALADAYRQRARDADADARIAIRDALRELAGPAYADSVERANPPVPPAAAGDPARFDAPPAERGAVLTTTRGDIEWAFFRVEAPQTVRNFVALAERGYFAGTFFHRVVPNFVIQDGDPTGTGAGGPGYSIRCEYNPLRYERGMVGMALSGKDTGGSQWFVTQSPQPHLNGRYTLFARVVRGMEVVDRITQGDRVLEVRILR